MRNILIDGLKEYSWFNQRWEEITLKIYEINKLFSVDKLLLHIIIMPTNSRLSKELAIDIPLWVTGVSCQPNIIYLVINKNTDDSIVKIFIHEYVHIVKASTFAGVCPMWLNEGLALYLADQIKSLGLVSLDDGYSFYDTEEYDQNLYNSSGYMVLKLVEKYRIIKLVNHVKFYINFKDDDYVGLKNLKRMCLL